MEKEVKEIKDDIRNLTESFKKFEKAMIGDKLERKQGYLDQVDSNTDNIKINKDDIKKIKANNRTPWSKIGIASGAGVGFGGIGATKGGMIFSKIIEFFS